MTDVTDTMNHLSESAEAQEWGAPERDSEAYPETPLNPHNHRFTISLDNRGPHLAIRGNTAQEIADAYADAEAVGLTTLLAGIWSHMKGEFLVAQGLGPVSPAPAAQGAPAAPPAFPVAPPQGQFNQQPAQQFPGQAGTAPAAWQNAGAPAPAVQDNLPEYRQHGWLACFVPFKPKDGNPGKPAFDQLTQKFGMRKGRPSENGQFSFNPANKTWYITPEAGPSFGQFSPVPA